MSALARSSILKYPCPPLNTQFGAIACLELLLPPRSPSDPRMHRGALLGVLALAVAAYVGLRAALAGDHLVRNYRIVSRVDVNVEGGGHALGPISACCTDQGIIGGSHATPGRLLEG